MSETIHTVEKDLTFMRSLVEGDDRLPPLFGVLYAIGGLIYGVEAIVGWLQAIGSVNLSPAQSGWLSLSFTVLFCVVLTSIVWFYRDAPRGGVSARTFSAGFAATGFAAVTIVCVVGAASWRFQNPALFLLMPPLVFAVQGTAWFVAFMVRRRASLLLVALGWFAAAVGLGALIGRPSYALLVGTGLLLLMVVPGVAIMLRNRAA